MAPLEIKVIEGKGRGVFAGRNFRAEEVIEVCPGIILSAEENAKIKKTKLKEYVFNLRDDQAIIALGFGSLYNHSYEPNATFGHNIEEQFLLVKALREIKIGEEITINYNCDPNDKSPVGFSVIK